MDIVQPIQDRQILESFKHELMKISYRDYFLFFLGINTGLRVSDLLKLRVCDVAHKEHITINEKKTGKVNKFKINQSVAFEITRYILNMKQTDYLFTSN